MFKIGFSSLITDMKNQAYAYNAIKMLYVQLSFIEWALNGRFPTKYIT